MWLLVAWLLLTTAGLIMNRVGACADRKAIAERREDREDREWIADLGGEDD